MIGIYKITNNINGQAYIGQSVDIGKRWTRHKNGPFNSEDHSYDCALYRAIRKYGIDNFTFEVLEECNIENLNSREIYWIQYYDTFHNGYNETAGGDSGHGHFMSLSHDGLAKIIELLQTTTYSQKVIADMVNISEEMVQGINTGRYWHNDSINYPIRKKISTNRIYNTTISTHIDYYCKKCGKPVKRGTTGYCADCYNQLQSHKPDIPVDELVEDIVAHGFAAVGRKYGVSDNSVKKWLNNTGWPTSKQELKEEWARRYRQNHGLPAPLASDSSKPKQVQQFDLSTGAYIQTYPSLSEAGRAIGHADGGSHIRDVCLGRRQSAYGYTWKFTTEEV